MSDSPKYLDESLSFAERAKDLVSRMTLEEKASQMVYTAPAIPRLGIPAYNWWNEALHGVARAGTATMFPQAIAMAAMFDADMVDQACFLPSSAHLLPPAVSLHAKADWKLPYSYNSVFSLCRCFCSFHRRTQYAHANPYLHF